MSMGMFILSSVLVLVSVIISYYETGRMNWLLLFAAVALNGAGIARTVKLYKDRKSEEDKPDNRS